MSIRAKRSCSCSSGSAGAAEREFCDVLVVQSACFELYHMGTSRHFLYQKRVAFARAHRLKAAARAFACSRNTVRKWRRCDLPGQPASLQEKSRRPDCCSHETSDALTGQILKLRHQTGFGAERLHRGHDPPSFLRKKRGGEKGACQGRTSPVL